MNVEVIQKDLPNFRGEAWLVKRGDDYFVVSGVSAMFTGWEVLVFPTNADGKVSEWLEVCGGRGISHNEAIEELESAEIRHCKNCGLPMRYWDDDDDELCPSCSTAKADEGGA